MFRRFTVSAIIKLDENRRQFIDGQIKLSHYEKKSDKKTVKKIKEILIDGLNNDYDTNLKYKDDIFVLFECEETKVVTNKIR